MNDHRGLSACCGLLFSITCSMLLPMSARASGDLCGAEWRLDHGDAECQNVAALKPDNDTRVNMLLLMAARDGLSPAFPAPVSKPVFTWVDLRDRLSPKAPDDNGLASGEGSRCRSDASGRAAFDAAVKTAKEIPSTEQAALVAARAGFKDCGADNGADAAIEGVAKAVASSAARAFVTYLRGAGAFYAGRFDEAAKDFESLRSNADPWLADTADYMVARSAVNALQSDAFDQYGTFAGSEKIDQGEARQAEAGFARYLKNHPDGRYAASARGLLRRVAWLAGWTDKLAAEYAAILAQPASARDFGALPLVDEIDAKLLPSLKPELTNDPILLSVLDLRDMRRVREKDPVLTHANLDAQRETFAAMPALYELLQAADALYVDKAPGAVLKGVPDATHRRDGDALWFSRQILRGEALEEAGDRNARGFWKELYAVASRPLDRATIELALALHEEKHGDVADVFAPGSLVADPAMRAILLAHDAGPALLRRQASDRSAPALEREVALFTLLDKELMRGRYAEFLSDLQNVPGDAPVVGSVDLGTMHGRPPLGLFVRGEFVGEIGCPALATTVSQLAQDPSAARDRLCLAEFVRINYLTENPLDVPGGGGARGSGPAESFPGEAHTRDETYKAIIADKSASAADRAFALYRAVKCYEPVGNNGCGSEDVSKGQRKTWYYALKRDYPSTRWAKDLRYWW